MSTLKLKGWKPHPPPREGAETRAYRQLIIEAVTIIYEHNRQLYARMGFPPRPVTLGEIYKAVIRKARALKRAGKWPYPIRGKRWIDRRVNEAACPDFYLDGVPKIVAASAGRYMPNPALTGGGKVGEPASPEKSTCIDPPRPQVKPALPPCGREGRIGAGSPILEPQKRRG